jgi:hypothetical protein
MNEFIELVREMRNAQKEYFKTRDKSVLLKSKELERIEVRRLFPTKEELLKSL